MTTVNGLDFLKYIDSNGSGNGSGGTASVSTFINSAWTVANPDTETEDKVKAGINFGMQALLTFFGKQEEAAAKVQTGQNEAKIEQIDNNLRTVADNTNQHVQEIISQIEKTIEQIQENIKEAEDANEEKETYQKEVEAHIESLNNAQAILNDSNATKEEKKEALTTVTAVRSSVEGLLEKVTKMNETIVAVNEETEELQANNDDLSTESTEILDNGSQVLQNNVQEVAAEEAKNTATNTTAIANQGISTAAATAAATASAGSAIPILGTGVAALAQKLMNVSGDFGGASGLRFASFAKIRSQIASTTDLINTNFAQFANFSNALGGLSNDSLNFSETFYTFAGVIGEWSESSIGTFETQAETLAQVEENIAANIGEDSESPEAENKDQAPVAETRVELGAEELEKLLA